MSNDLIPLAKPHAYVVIMWEVNQYDNHAQVIAERNRLDIDRKNELVDITNASIEAGDLRFSVTNERFSWARNL